MFWFRGTTAEESMIVAKQGYEQAMVAYPFCDLFRTKRRPVLALTAPDPSLCTGWP